jgi:hypothetical protein
VILKSISIHLQRHGLLNSSEPDDRVYAAIGETFFHDLEALVKMLAKDIVFRGNTKLSLMRQANRSLAHFLRDLFALLPKKHVTELVNLYCLEVIVMN